MADQRAAKPSLIRTLAENLWFCVVLFAGFAVIYLIAFHHPQPHHVPVAVADPAAAAHVRAALDQASPGGFDVRAVPGAGAARRGVLDRSVAAAFVADAAHPVLYVAKANGVPLETVLTQAFTPQAARGTTLTVTDLAPTAPGDATGNGLFYLVLAWAFPSYFAVMMLLRAVGLSRRGKVLTLLGWDAFLAVAGYFIARSMDVVPDAPAVLAVAFLFCLVISLTSQGLVPIFKQFFPGVAVVLFIILSVASSSGAMPSVLEPAFFRALHPILPMGNLIDAVRGIAYFHGAGVAGPVLVLGAWFALGTALNTGHAVWVRRQTATVSAGPPVEDPSLEMPIPTALPPREHHFGELTPMLIGTVRSTTGERVAGANLTVTDGRGRQLVRTRTDADGAFAVGGLPEQFVDLVVTARGRRPVARRVFFQEGVFRREEFVLAAEPETTAIASRR
ncbi:carboxypeptidase regulatory-like domain-containing protein [Amycolatopsis sp. FDAARGOS 1241]|uniref:carboxypeptidase regulatory-like domain-containing protein n=1 Tax=Amycolatopsis sp. FDAARGOS 1241 TaxID=2778070 RepID=UPI001950D28C|nr:carboxypeptidase regulatory-like domain-containing protein [Amycolatopsis sp. FDAARGOS 1241]QRP47563.1 carboxypeptidase regulatory-like domain-containing protein [Amycolatopsis sp. FDAARGOS 1241]